MGKTASTQIEWADATFNPWVGCEETSPGCAHCYMFTSQRRYGNDPTEIRRTTDKTFYAPQRNKDWLALPAGSKVFACSWSDWFHPEADKWRDDAWEVIRARPDLIWLILTKRPERIAEHLPEDWGQGWPNVWLGVTIENRRFTHRADTLATIPAAVRFISAEPLLGPIMPEHGNEDETWWDDDWQGSHPDGAGYDGLVGLKHFDWIIFGGESGPKARPMNQEWLKRPIEMILQLREHHGLKTRIFVKQLGNRLAEDLGATKVGRDPTEWPEWMRLREFPNTQISSRRDAKRSAFPVALKDAGLTPRTARVVAALLACVADTNYGPRRTHEVHAYDSDSASSGSTRSALNRALAAGFVSTTTSGLWSPSEKANALKTEISDYGYVAHYGEDVDDE